MNKEFNEALKNQIIIDRSGPSRFDLDENSFVQGARWALARAREPHDATTCPVGHPRACLIPCSKNCAYCNDPFYGHPGHQKCSACKLQREAVDAALLECETIASQQMAITTAGIIHDLREEVKAK